MKRSSRIRGRNTSGIKNSDLLSKVQSLSSSVITIQQQLSEVTSFLANANNSVNVLPIQGSNSLQNMQHDEGSVPGLMHTTTSNVTFGDVPPATVTNSSGSGNNISGSQSDCMSSINVQNTVTNLPLTVSDNNKDSTCMSVSLQQVLSLGSTISDSLKNKIWSNEFVDLSLLLTTIHNKAQALPLVVQGDGNEKQIAVQENTKHIKTIDQWVSSFSVFMAVYCHKFKDAAPDLIKYMDTIRNMFKQKGDWYQYDIEFQRSKLQLQISWGNMHHHLWLTHMLKKKNK